MPAQLYPEDGARSAFCGFVRVAGAEFKLRVRGVSHVDGRSVFDAASLDAEPPLAALLAPHRETLHVRLAQATSLAGFMSELEELIAICRRSSGVSSLSEKIQRELPAPAYYSRLLDELDAIGWSHVVQLNEELKSLELQTRDGAGRTHSIRISIPSDFGASVSGVEQSKRYGVENGERPTRLECFVDAPEPFEPVLGTGDARTDKREVLSEVLSQFEAFLGKFQGFWNVLDDLDANTCVLEPHHPTRAAGRRRIALGKHMSLQLEVDPAAPVAICEVTFFGNDATVAPLRERWSSNVFQWDDTLFPRENLEAVLAVAFPAPSARKLEEFAIECGICYSYRLELDSSDANDMAAASRGSNASKEPRTIIPDRLCDNRSCNRPFHEKCLFDWLKALPTARQSFNTVFGECPYCRESISAKFVV